MKYKGWSTKWNVDIERILGATATTAIVKHVEILLISEFDLRNETLIFNMH